MAQPASHSTMPDACADADMVTTEPSDARPRPAGMPAPVLGCGSLASGGSEPASPGCDRPPVGRDVDGRPRFLFSTLPQGTVSVPAGTSTFGVRGYPRPDRRIGANFGERSRR